MLHSSLNFFTRAIRASAISWHGTHTINRRGHQIIKAASSGQTRFPCSSITSFGRTQDTYTVASSAKLAIDCIAAARRSTRRGRGHSSRHSTHIGTRVPRNTHLTNGLDALSDTVID